MLHIYAETVLAYLLKNDVNNEGVDFNDINEFALHVRKKLFKEFDTNYVYFGIDKLDVDLAVLRNPNAFSSFKEKIFKIEEKELEKFGNAYDATAQSIFDFAAKKVFEEKSNDPLTRDIDKYEETSIMHSKVRNKSILKSCDK